MDLLQGVKDAIHEDSDVSGEIPSVDQENADGANLEKLLKIMKKLNLTDENEEQLRETLMKKSKMGMLGGFMPDALNKIENSDTLPEKHSESYNIVLLLVLIFLIFMVLVFFGYKLYKSHTDRERKREEKRRLKQQKKKK